jgi:hypothetical protein
MRHLLGLWAAVGLLASAPLTFAQDNKPSTDDRIDRLERRFEAELKIRDEKIARLEKQLAEKNGATSQPAKKKDDTSDLIGEIEAAKPGGPPRAEVEGTRQDVSRDATARSAFGRPAPISFNPDFAVVTDYHASLSTDNDNPARNRFDIGSVELDLRAAVDPRADGVVILPVSRDIDDPLFFKSKSDSSGNVDTSIDIEEAYLFLHDFGVPNLTAKLGRFHLRFGRQNILHSHDWPTSDNNFVNQSFLGPESLNDAGLSLSYVIPPKLLNGNYVEVIAEIISGEGSKDDPVLNNDALVDSPALNLHVLWNRDVAPNWNLELGGSYLTGKHNDDSRQDVNLFGGDVTLIHTDPTGRFNNLLIESEAIYGIVDTSRIDTQYSYGAYLLIQQQINRDWYLGCRFDWTKNALNEHQEVWGLSPYVSWYWSEFLRWRLEYQHKDGDVKREDTLYFQATWIFGAHPPHPYWAMR